jgi:hypothetical protein
MPKITLKLENLKSGDASFREFDNEEATIAFCGSARASPTCWAWS